MLQVRPDGSRYIARRPTRTFLLRQREKQIAEERSGQTSDDDAASEELPIDEDGGSDSDHSKVAKKRG